MVWVPKDTFCVEHEGDARVLILGGIIFLIPENRVKCSLGSVPRKSMDWLSSQIDLGWRNCCNFGKRTSGRVKLQS